MRLGWKIVVAVCTGASMWAAGSAWAAASSSRPNGGAIQLMVQPGLTQGSGKILVTGAIGDHGTTTPEETSGNTTYAVATLKRGTFQINLTELADRFDSMKPRIDSATCSAEVSASAPAAIFKGTGAYSDVKGTVSLTETFAFIAPRYKGKCNGNATVVQMGVTYGSGSVTF